MPIYQKLLTGRKFKRKSTKPVLKKKTVTTVTAKATTTGSKAYQSSSIKKQPFKHNEWANLKYNWADKITSSATQYTSGSQELWNLNAVNKPYMAQSTGDPIPSGLTYYSGLFSKYKVHGTAIKLQMHPNKTGKDLTLLIMANNDTNNQTVGGKTELGIAGFQRVWTYPLPTDKPFVWKKYYPTYALEAISKRQFNADITYYEGIPYYSAAVQDTGIPLRLTTFSIALINNTDATAVSVDFELDLQYYTNFTGRQRITGQTTIA